ncbi:MAG TPA: PLP-dependent aspartate aminotransferase family protein [Rhodothermia bacterium]|nr:PLP-dependent aspartate aminotransferase family protein [Rhodothermia bacterium]
MNDHSMRLETLLAIAGQRTDSGYNSICPPIYQTANFRFDDVGSDKGFDYTRSGNPTRAAFEETLARLEGGAGAVALASGMAAIATTLSIFHADAHVICSHDCYGGTDRLFCHLEKLGKIQVSFVDLTDEKAFRSAIRPNTQAVWVETPSNPLSRITDVRAVSAVAREHNLTVIVDNTFLSPILQRPFDLGADLVVYSTTKYLNGHSDVVGGAIVAKTETLNEQIQFVANAYGAVAGPFDCWLVLRGLKTLPVRMKAHEANANAVARFLDAHPFVERVFYPGLESDSGHAVAKSQQHGFGGMVSFAVKGGFEAAKIVLRSTRVFALAESLGGVESLIEHPASMSHASMRPEQRALAGISDNIIRLSVGIEAQEDLVEDLERALRLASAAKRDLEKESVAA